MLFNPAGDAVTFALPSPSEGQRWGLVADTAARSPDDFLELEAVKELESPRELQLEARSSVMLRTLE
jgi:hypothetical protein